MFFCHPLILERCRWTDWWLTPTNTLSELFRRRTLSPSCFRPLPHREFPGGIMVRPPLSTTLFSSDDKILHMESDLLFSEFENDKTSREIQEHIRAMSCGKIAFQAETLGFVYHKLSTKKREAIQNTPKSPKASSSGWYTEPSSEDPETTVYCTRIHLPRHAYALSELLQGLYCPSCSEYGKNGRGELGRPFTRCGLCGTLRDTLELRCSHCNILFKSVAAPTSSLRPSYASWW